jgi:hypothetical protein
VQVSTLRKVLGNRSIATLPGRGYRFTLPVDGEEEAGPSCALPGFRHNLPAQLNSFVGREREIAEVKQALMNAPGNADGQRRHRKDAPVAAGGRGAGRRLSGRRVAGRARADRREQRVPQVVAFILGVKEEAGRPVVEALVKFVRTSRSSSSSTTASTWSRPARASPSSSSPPVRRSRFSPPAASRSTFPAKRATPCRRWRCPRCGREFVEGGAVDEISALQQCEAVRLFVDRACAVNALVPAHAR